MKFCPKCGKKGIIGVLCRECSLEQSFITFKEIKLKSCINCNAYLFRNKWTRTNNIESAVRNVVKKSIKKKTTAEITPLLPRIEPKPGLSHDFEVEIKVSPKEKYFIPGKIELTTCPKCSKQGTEYFEGILQLRNPNDEVISFIRKEAKKQKSRGIYITNEKRIAHGKGIDFYFTSQKYIQNLGLKLQKTFGGILKISPRLFSRDRQTGKELYRVNVLFEMLDFRIGDAVLAEDKIIKVTEIGKRAIGYDLKTEKKTVFDYRKKDYEVLEKKKTAVVKVYPETEVLNPETYQGIKVRNKKKVNVDDEVEIVIVGGIAYLI